MGSSTDDRARNEARSWPWPRGGLAALAAVLLALVLVAGACSGDDDDAATEASSDESAQFDGDDAADDAGRGVAVEAEEDADSETDAGADEEAMGEGAPADAGSTDTTDAESPLGAGGVSVTPTAADLGRKLIFTAFLSVGVDDVAEASAEATTIIEDLGGFLFGQSTEGGPEARSELIFKVLPDDFNRALERLGSVGELRNQTVTTDDVTERVVDLESRIEVAELGVARLRAALEGTQTLEDYAEVERLLLERESELEIMRGQLRTLQDRIDLATITLTLTQERVENRVEVVVSVYDGHDQGRSCPGQEGISVEEGTDVTVCFEVTNAGDQTLTDIVLTDSVLEIDEDTELLVVFGELDELAPGQSALLAHETDIERTVRMRTRVVATPTDGVSDTAAGPSVNAQGSAEVRTFPSEEGPGFGDGFGAAVDVLVALWTAATVTIGFLIPLLVLLPILWLLWLGVRAVRRRRPARPSGPTAGSGGTNPPPPPPPPPSSADQEESTASPSSPA